MGLIISSKMLLDKEILDNCIVSKIIPFDMWNRDRDKCKNCMWYNHLSCTYVKIDGTCSLTGIKVTKDYTYGRSLYNTTIHK